MVLVYVRCRRCRAVLAEVTERPSDASVPLTVPPCQRHDRPRPGQFIKWAAAAASRGEAPSLILERRIEWSELLPLIRRAEASGRPMNADV